MYRGTWLLVGIPMLLFSAALIAIPDEVFEAARVDGASAVRAFWSIQLPLIAPPAEKAAPTPATPVVPGAAPAPAAPGRGAVTP